MELSDYESARKDRIRKNRELLSSLGLDKTSAGATAVPDMTASQSRSRKRKERNLSTEDTLEEPRPKRITRSALRLGGAASDDAFSSSVSSALAPSIPPLIDLIDRTQTFPLDKVVVSGRSELDEVQSTAHVRSIFASAQLQRAASVSASTATPAGYVLCEKWEPGFMKIVKDRIYSLELYPARSTCMVLVGDKGGRVALWNVKSNDIHSWRPHSKPAFAIFDTDTSFASVSYDGQLRRAVRSGKDPFADSSLLWQHSFTSEPKALVCLYLTRDFYQDLETGAFDLLLDQDHMLTSLVFNRKNSFLCGSNAGTLSTVDPRAHSRASSTVELHDRKICALSLHPTRDLVVTCSLDKSLQVFDLRKLTPKHSVSRLEHDQGVSHVSFSPISGHKIVSTSFDDTIRIWSDWEASSASLEIRHNNNTGRWISPFRTTWDPTEDMIVVGNMSRAVDVFDSKSRKHLYSMTNGLTAIPSLNQFHKYHNLIASATASGRVYLYGWESVVETKPCEADDVGNSE